MKNSIKGYFFALISIVLLSSSSTHKISADSYDIIGVYEKVQLKDGTKVLESYGGLKSVKEVYVPTKIDTGRYEVELTRVESNFYQICGTSVYIETKYCHEYATRDDAILNIRSNYGYTRGEVIFLE